MLRKTLILMMLMLGASLVGAQEATPVVEPTETAIGAVQFTLPAGWVAVQGQDGALLMTNTALENIASRTYPAGTAVIQVNPVPSYLLTLAGVATDLTPAELLSLTAGDETLEVETITLGERDTAKATRLQDNLRSDLYTFALSDSAYAIASSIGLDETALDLVQADIETILGTLTLDLTGDLPEASFDYSTLPQGYSVDSFPMLGSTEARAKLTEISSFSCPHCAEFHADMLPQLLNLVAAGDVSFAYVPFYGAGSVGDGEAAAMAAMCADQQGAFWEYHDALFSWQKYGVFAFERARLLDGATNLELDVDAFATCLDEQGGRPGLDAAISYTRELSGFQGTPTLLLNGKFIVSAPFEAIQLAILSAQTDEATPEATAEVTPEATPGS